MRQSKSYSKGRVSAMPQAAQAVDLKTAVLKALEDEQYDWRTISGLARTVDVSAKDITRTLESMSDQIVRATADDGRVLFTTRNHYEKTHGFRDKLLSALADKVVA
jgi:hypothetical protein